MAWLGYFEEIPDPPRGGGGGGDSEWPAWLIGLAVVAAIVAMILKCTGNWD